MGYSIDKSSPKKANASGFQRGPIADLKRKFSSRRYICLWIFVAVVPCYVLRQMFFYQTPTAAVHVQKAEDGQFKASSDGKTIPDEKPTEVRDQRASGTIKPATYATAPPPPAQFGENVTRNSLKLRLKDNFAEDEEDFGVPEDNDKAEEQSWRAPPSPLRMPATRRSWR